LQRFFGSNRGKAQLCSIVPENLANAVLRRRDLLAQIPFMPCVVAFSFFGSGNIGFRLRFFFIVQIHDLPAVSTRAECHSVTSGLSAAA
jgi:hypothetical protein